MGPLASVVVLLNALAQMLSASLPVLAFDRYGDAKTAGWLFAAYGLGGLIGTLIAFQLVKHIEPLVMASIAALGFALPLWVLVARVPLAAILAAIAFTAMCGPLINAPMFGLITTRTPQALLPKVMTAIITLATVAGPLGLILAGFLLQHEGLTVTFTVIAAGVTCVCLVFAALLTRFRRRELQTAAAAASS
jgi:predicted MFS family arabinose efflux permease